QGTGAWCNECFSYGIYGGAFSTIEDNEFYNISGYTIHMYSSGGGQDNGTLRHNYFHDTAGPVLVGCGGSGNQVYGNVLYRVGRLFSDTTPDRGAGLIFGGNCAGTPTSNNVAYNNTIVDSRGACIALSYAGGVEANGNVVRNNICWKNDVDGVM